jgi:Protein of unknown function (DUF4232)
VRAVVRLASRGAAVAAFGATAALAVALNRPAPAPAALTTDTRAHSVPVCTATVLAVSLADGVRVVDFTNTSGSACILSGYPTVTAYDARPDGYRQVGTAAAVDSSVVVGRVLLRPGATAHSYLDVSSVAPGVACRPVTVTGLRVVPPGASRPQYLRVQLTTCSAIGPGARASLHVRPVQPGPGIVADGGTANGARHHNHGTPANPE